MVCDRCIGVSEAAKYSAQSLRHRTAQANPDNIVSYLRCAVRFTGYTIRVRMVVQLVCVCVCVCVCTVTKVPAHSE